MLLGKNLILATKPFAREIRARSWYNTISTLFLLIFMLSGALLFSDIVLKAICSILAGLLLIRMFIIYHDYQHHTILTKSPAAEVIMTIFGMYMLSPSSIWKRSHDHHHNHNSKLFSASIGSYPIVTKKKYMEMTPVQKFTYLAIRHPITIALGYLFMFIIGMCLRSFISNPRKHYDSLIALIIHFAVAILLFVFVGWQAWFFMFFLPFFISFGLGSYLFYAQHNFPNVEFYENKDWVYEKAALASSSFMKMNPVMAWFTGNIGYHHIHHLNSKIPFYRLPEVMKHFAELQNCKTTSLTPRAMMACLKLKVWDQDSNRMIGVKSL
jgi:omega-6 fatty acid desaturase (delta-12 desaturase)